MAKTDLNAMGQRGLAAARVLATLPTERKDTALRAIAGGLRADAPAILHANAEDVANAEASGLKPSMIDRLLLTPARIESIAADVEHVITLTDPVGLRF